MNIIETMSVGQIASIIVSGALILAMVMVHYVDWTIRRDARKFPDDRALQEAAALQGHRPIDGGWTMAAFYSAFFGAVLGILSLGFGWHDVLQFAGVLFALGAGAVIGFIVRWR